MRHNQIQLDANRIARRVEELGEIGRNPETGGLHRFVYGPELRGARALLSRWMTEAGMTVREDAVGNLYGRYEGIEGGDAVIAGSHIDTVVEGGRFDGALGVIAAFSAIEALVAQRGQPRRPVEVLAICDEEGGRFQTNFWGSRAVAGGLSPAEAESRMDQDGTSLADAMRRDGYDPARVAEARRDDIAAWLELHIEQGRILEETGTDVAVVTAIAGHALWRITVRGRDDHAGTAPMDLRRDAMAGAVLMINAAMDATLAHGAPAVCTAGRMTAFPGIANVVPDEVIFSLDIRDEAPERFDALLETIRRRLDEVAAQRGLQLELEEQVRRDPTPLDLALIALLRSCAADAAVSTRSMPSMAGHDSEVMARRWSSAMLFVPSREGRSHTPAEFTSTAQFMPGIRVLTEALARLIY